MKLLRLLRADIFTGFIIFITSVLTVLDWFLTPVRSSNMDGIVHTLTPNLFYTAIKGGEFPVSWVDGFANYGLPLGVIAHQLTTYLTSFFEFLVNDPVIAFNLVAFLGFFLSFLFFYIFLRIYFNEIVSFSGALLFHLSAYRILNIYIRGALPEFFAAVFMPVLLIGMYLGRMYGGIKELWKNKNKTNDTKQNTDSSKCLDRRNSREIAVRLASTHPFSIRRA